MFRRNRVYEPRPKVVSEPARRMPVPILKIGGLPADASFDELLGLFEGHLGSLGHLDPGTCPIKKLYDWRKGLGKRTPEICRDRTSDLILNHDMV